MTERKTLVIAWIDRNARTEDLGHWLGAEVLFMPWARPGLPWPRRLTSWARSAWSTGRALRRSNEATIIVIEPPVFAPLVAWATRRRDCRLFLDLHSGAFIHPRWRWARPILALVARRSDGIIVTNTETLEGVDLGDTRAYVLHDPVWARPEPERESAAPKRDGASPYVLFPASANLDEPLELIESVGQILAGEPVIKITGVDRRGCAGVEYTGYLPREDYDALLRGAAAVLSLTRWEATMQRSAYEAVQAGVPVVALDRQVLRAAFEGAGVVFARDDAADIASCISYAVANHDELAAGTAEARARLQVGSELVRKVLLGEHHDASVPTIAPSSEDERRRIASARTDGRSPGRR